MALRKQSTRLFAVVDIETTGGHAAAHAITELAVLVHNGEQVVQRYHTLINPGCAIPRFITGLTGITDEMVADAPHFDDIAEEVYALLHDKVFVAHNVNFDYSFLRHHLMQSGLYVKCVQTMHGAFKPESISRFKIIQFRQCVCLQKH
jgi:DNA polymerase-3 subunit epsilon